MHAQVRKKSMLWVMFAIGAALCWGCYGVILHKGQVSLGNPLKALLCVGAAYFLLGVLVPIGALGSDSFSGFNRTGTIYVMPLVFGGAPVINVLYSMYLHPPKGEVNPLLWVGMVLVPVGAGLVLY